jgi:hypothetical protein
MAKIPLHPKNPERVCWGCDKYCPADALVCGNGTIRTQHPVELFGEDWLDWAIDSRSDPSDASSAADHSLVPVESLRSASNGNR